MSGFTDLDDEAVFKRNSMRSYSKEGKDLLVVNFEGTFYAVEGSCSHRGVMLQGGWLRDCKVVCPGHLSEFDLKDGSTKGSAAKQNLLCYEVRIVDGRVQVKF